MNTTMVYKYFTASITNNYKLNIIVHEMKIEKLNAIKKN